MLLVGCCSTGCSCCTGCCWGCTWTGCCTGVLAACWNILPWGVLGWVGLAAGLGVLAILIFIISILLGRRKKKKGQKNPKDINSEVAVTDKYSWTDIHEELKVQETPEQAIKKQLKEFTATNPEIAAQLIRTWLKGDDD